MLKSCYWFLLIDIYYVFFLDVTNVERCISKHRNLKITVVVTPVARLSILTNNNNKTKILRYFSHLQTRLNLKISKLKALNDKIILKNIVGFWFLERTNAQYWICSYTSLQLCHYVFEEISIPCFKICIKQKQIGIRTEPFYAYIEE